MAESETKGVTPTARKAIRQLQGDLANLTKARLSLLVVLTTCFGYLIATKGLGSFSWITFFHLTFGTILAAAGASVFNQLMEIDADAKMDRTSDRPLPANRVPKPLAFILGWLLCAFGIIHLGVMVNGSASLMAGLTLLTYLFCYTPMKRVSSANTLVGAVSGALPPIIGWAGGGKPIVSFGAAFLFALLFLWQLPHFAAINWMYREQYVRAGFRMWSDNDETGNRTARIAIICSSLLFLVGLAFPIFSPLMSSWGAIAGSFLGACMVGLSIVFFKSGERRDARILFFFTLLYLPLMMFSTYLFWSIGK